MPEQQGVMSSYQLTAHDHSGVGQGGLVDPSVINHDALLNFVGAEHLVLANTLINVLTDHNKVAHDALLIDAGQVDGIEGAEILQRNGSVPLTANWDAGAHQITSTLFRISAGGSFRLGEVAGALRIVRLNAEDLKIVGESNATGGLEVDQLVLGAFNLNALTANNKVPDSDKVDGEHAAAITTNARVKAHFPDTIANVLSNHTKAVHDALNIDADTIDGINGAEIILRNGSIPLTAVWDAGNFRIRNLLFWADSGGSISLGEIDAILRLVWDSNEVAKILGVSNNLATLKAAKVQGDTKLWLEAGVDGIGSLTIKDDTTASAANVYITDTATAHLFRSTSGKKYKDKIENLEVDSSLIYSLQPRSFNSLCKGDDKERRFVGLIADEIEQYYPEIINYNEKKEVESYDNQMLMTLILAEVQKLNGRVSVLEN